MLNRIKMLEGTAACCCLRLPTDAAVSILFHPRFQLLIIRGQVSPNALEGSMLVECRFVHRSDIIYLP